MNTQRCGGSKIRCAQTCESEQLTTLSIQSKSCWGYSPSEMAVFRNELRISPEYIQENMVLVFCVQANVVAYAAVKELKEDKVYPIVTIPKGLWLDHLFVHPDNMKKGYGSELFLAVRRYMAEQSFATLKILADPNSRIFYEKMGCHYVSEFPSSIPGRTVPFLVYEM